MSTTNISWQPQLESAWTFDWELKRFVYSEQCFLQKMLALDSIRVIRHSWKLQRICRVMKLELLNPKWCYCWTWAVHNWTLHYGPFCSWMAFSNTNRKRFYGNSKWSGMTKTRFAWEAWPRNDPTNLWCWDRVDCRYIKDIPTNPES